MATPADNVPAPPPPPAGIADLIREARENPANPIVEGLFHEREAAGLHGSPESFKTVFSLQLAEAIATGQRFLGTWQIPNPRRVYLFETEMSVPALGGRLSKMYEGRIAPEGVKFASPAELRKFNRAPNLEAKFKLLSELVARADVEVVIIDTANPFFRGRESPNDENIAGEFFDHLSALPVCASVFVRHNHKPRIDDSPSEGASRIRGSGQFADVPDLLLELRRKDKRTNKAELEVTKFRHGTKPDNLDLWFDAGEMRLVPYPPVIHLLLGGPLSRAELLNGLEKRFGVNQRKGDDEITPLRPFLRESRQRHSLVFELNRGTATTAEWFSRLPSTAVQAR